MSASLGLDTSNYTTSAAVYRPGGKSKNASRLLSVREGELGLRQSEALYQHIRCFPGRLEELRAEHLLDDISVIGASTTPRETDGSYMPCFLAGDCFGKSLACVLDVPFFSFSHQQGHVAAACWSAGFLELLDAPLLCWHLSGGTTELLLSVPQDGIPRMRILGGTEDIAAGQFIDRTGKRLSLPFPAGKALDQLAQESDSQDVYPVKLRGLRFSLSGMENQVQKRIDAGISPENVARFALNTLISVVVRTTEDALRKYPGLPVICSGGVASNTLLRKAMGNAIFADPLFSTDNAMGIAILAYRAGEMH